MTEEQTLFEDTLYRDYFSRSIKFIEGKQFAECTAKPKADLFFKKTRGNNSFDYADEQVSAMWYAWKLAKGIAE